uniref:Putative secreted protein n=1 Tax=Anopheles triannulatus TaxID=58253 RepID=A0A2M4B6H6_9DIPT
MLLLCVWPLVFLVLRVLVSAAAAESAKSKVHLRFHEFRGRVHPSSVRYVTSFFRFVCCGAKAQYKFPCTIRDEFAGATTTTRSR